MISARREATNRGRDLRFRGDRLDDEVRRMRERMAQLERLIAEAMRKYK